MAVMSDQPQQLQVGSSVLPLYVERRMRVFAITESEFASVSTLNAQTNVFLSVGTAILTAAASIWVNAIFYTDVPPAAYVAKAFVAPVGILVALAFYYLAYSAHKSRTSTWENIMAESASLSTSGSASPAVLS
jgi:hypothetical protein